MIRARWLATALVGTLCACGCQRAAPPSAPEELEPGDSAHPALVAHTAEFERTVYPVAEGVHQAVGFGLANSILVEGDDCVFVVDVMGSTESARAVRAEFEKITPKPIRALIYTHNHADHVFGGLGFVPDGSVDVYAHETTEYYIDRVVSILRPILSVRSARMFGTHLPATGPDRVVNDGIGPFLEIGHGGGTLGLIRPNRTLRDRLETEICGVRVELVHAPGETNDQIFVWLPGRRVLLPGDNVYKAFPNLYTIRGTPHRDVVAWVSSLDAMRALAPDALAPSHTRPVLGAETVAEVLTAYRDGIQYVHDQTVRGMNQGITPDELAEAVVLPPHLRNHPYLAEFYGTVAWSVRAIYDGYLGWFDGDAATLAPASPDERAAGMADLAGRGEPLLAAAERALEAERYAWAAELASHLLRLDPEQAEARAVKARALRELGRRSISPNGRNYYLTQALELEGAVPSEARPIDDSVLALVSSIPIRNFVAAMPVRLDPVRSAEVDTVAGFRFPDVGEGYTIHVRRGVAEFQPLFPPAPDLAFTADSAVWREVALGRRNLALAIAAGELELQGGKIDAVRFLRLFR